MQIFIGNEVEQIRLGGITNFTEKTDNLQKTALPYLWALYHICHGTNKTYPQKRRHYKNKELASNKLAQ
jgi:hypothetical protein